MKVLLLTFLWVGIWALLITVDNGSEPAAQLPPLPPPPVLLPGCIVEPGKANAGGTRFNCPGSEWLGGNDWQGGTFVPGDQKKLNSNFSAGDREHPGYVVLVADVGKGLIVDNGEPQPRKLLVLRDPKWGRSDFRIQVRFKRGLVACDARGCLNVMRTLRQR